MTIIHILDKLHDNHIIDRRAQILARHLAGLIPGGAVVLDVGCGNGLLSRMIMNWRDDIKIDGLDVHVRSPAFIPMHGYDGEILPCHDNSYDVVMFIDVLHHTKNIQGLLTEAKRVAGKTIIVKDHLADDRFSRPRLRFMDYVGNARFGVNLPNNYWQEVQWRTAFNSLDLSEDQWLSELGLYPWWADWLFGKGLHFIAKLERLNQ
jgi:SAM-dependent methyltransferase